MRGCGQLNLDCIEHCRCFVHSLGQHVSKLSRLQRRGFGNIQTLKKIFRTPTRHCRSHWRHGNCRFLNALHLQIQQVHGRGVSSLSFRIHPGPPSCSQSCRAQRKVHDVGANELYSCAALRACPFAESSFGREGGTAAPDYGGYVVMAAMTSIIISAISPSAPFPRSNAATDCNRKDPQLVTT